MTALETVTDVYCIGTDCPALTSCTVCSVAMCPAHSDEFETCCDNPDLLHHPDCVDECTDCTEQRARDRIDNESW